MRRINSKECVLIVYTFKGRHKYLPYIDEGLSSNFDFLDRILVSNEAAKFRGRVLFNNNQGWCQNLLEGLKEVREIYNCQYVFFLLEDLFPLKPIPYEEFKEYLSVIKTRDIKYLSFRTYDFGDIPFRLELDGKFYFQFNSSFKFYSQLQPSFWQLEYFISMLEKANSAGINDPWSFEFCRSDEIHLMSDYKWPNVLGGFFEYGFINIKSLPPILGHNPYFYLILLRDYLISRPRYLVYRAKRYLSGLYSRLLL